MYRAYACLPQSPHHASRPPSSRIKNPLITHEAITHEVITHECSASHALLMFDLYSYHMRPHTTTTTGHHTSSHITNASHHTSSHISIIALIHVYAYRSSSSSSEVWGFIKLSFSLLIWNLLQQDPKGSLAQARQAEQPTQAEGSTSSSSSSSKGFHRQDQGGN